MSHALDLRLLLEESGPAFVEKYEEADDKSLRARLQFHIDCSGIDVGDITHSIGGFLRGREVADFLYGRPCRFLASTRKAIVDYLDTHEDKRFPLENPLFCETSIARKMSVVMQCCKDDSDLGIIVGPSGIGKTEVLRQQKRKDRSTIIVTADPATRAPGSMLFVLSRMLPGVRRESATNAEFLVKVISFFKTGGKRLLIIDESHFLPWESFEIFRKIFDSTEIGLVFCGQQTLYDQMRGGTRKAMLWDQIFSRIGLRAHFTGDVPLEDVRMIVDKLYPQGLDRKCLEYLHHKANGRGRFRSMVKLLQRAMMLAEVDNSPITLTILQQVSKLMMV